jgi:hypothetical protein
MECKIRFRLKNSSSEKQLNFKYSALFLMNIKKVKMSKHFGLLIRYIKKVISAYS